MMNNENKILTAGVLREKLGDYPVIQELTKGKADDYVFDYNLLDRNDYVADKLWYKEDIATKLRELGYKGTKKEIEAVLRKQRTLDKLGDATEEDWYLIEYACREAGF